MPCPERARLMVLIGKELVSPRRKRPDSPSPQGSENCRCKIIPLFLRITGNFGSTLVKSS